MENNERSSRIRRLNIFLAVIVLLLAGACAYLIHTQQTEKATREAAAVKEQILKEKSRVEQEKRDRAVYEKCMINALKYNRSRKAEFSDIDDGNYEILFLTNTNVIFRAEWVEFYYGKNTLVPQYRMNSPEIIGQYLEVALGCENITDVFLEIDPYILEQSYYAKHKYDVASNLTFMQMMQQILWKYMSEYDGVTFHIMMPIRSIEVIQNYSMEEYARRHDAWDQFIKFSSRYSNVVMTSLSTEEWIISNKKLFDDQGCLLEEYGKLFFATQIAYESYRFDYNEFEEMWNELDAAVKNNPEGDYYRIDLSGEDIVFFGDSILHHYDAELVNTPDMIQTLTNANVYNLSVRGATASDNESDVSFCRMVEAFLNNNANPETQTQSASAAISEFNNTSHSDNKITFVILYGFNDYSCNVNPGEKTDTDEDTFFGALNKGVALLKEKYPEAHIILASPLYTLVNDHGTKGFVKDGYPLTKYVSAVKKCAKYNESCFINLYSNSGINEKNANEYLGDKVHPDVNGSYEIAKRFIEHFIAEKRTTASK